MDEMTQDVAAEPLIEDAPSISDHAAQFGPGAQRVDMDDETDTTSNDDAVAKPAAEPNAAIRPGETQQQANQRARDAKTGQFTRERHRAKSQQASAADVPRIQGLTAKLRAAEEELARLRQTATAPRPEPRHEPRPEPRAAAVVPDDDPEPQETDAKYEGDYGKFLRDAARWDARQTFREQQQRQVETQQRQQVEQTARQRHEAFQGRIQASAAKYPDFEPVVTALGIIPDELIDAWVREHDAGAELLYHFGKHPHELDALMRMPGTFDKAAQLTLLSQRLAPSSRTPVGSAGSTAAPRVAPVPRPPNPARTGFIRTDDEPQGEASSISDHARQFGPKRR